MHGQQNIKNLPNLSHNSMLSKLLPPS